MTTIIKTHNLSKKYHHRWAVSDLNLEVLKGQIFGFLGPNGAGKSTTIKILLSLVSPTKGKYELFGNNPQYKGNSIYSRIGALVEEPDFYLYLSAWQNLKFLADITGNISKTRIDEVLDIVQLKDRKKDKVKSFSHGMRQRLGIAQAILGKPELLILDEPTSGLSPEGIKDTRELIKRLSEEENTTILLSSHRLHEIEQICSHMAILDYGKLIVQGDVSSLLHETDFFITEIIIDKPEDAMKFLLSESFLKKMTVSGEKLKIHVSSTRRPEVIKKLVEKNFKISSVIPRTSLEDYYLSLIEKRHIK